MIKLSGVRKTSLIDFPEHIVAVLFTQGCNFTCPYCQNPQLIKEPPEDREYIEVDLFLDFMQQRKNLLDGICITGGEPLRQRELQDFLEKIKAMNFKVKIDTNGSYPERLNTLIMAGMLDYIAMDIKFPLTSYDIVLSGVPNQKTVTGKIKKSINLILKSGINHEFRTTVVPGMHRPRDIKEISQLIGGAEKYFIQNFRGGRTLNPDLEGTRGFPDDELNNFRRIAEKNIGEVKIRR